jgi:hypothetical protein
MSEPTHPENYSLANTDNHSAAVVHSAEPDSSVKLRSLTARILEAERALKAGEKPEVAALSELREALDNLRLTAWTINELLNAREMKVNPRKVLSFMVAERVRRLTTLARDLAHDIENAGGTPDTSEMRALQEALGFLQARLQTPIR